MYDVVVIGAGPAGISAGIYAKRANAKTLVLYYGDSNLEKAEKIENYYGFEQGITGKRLYNRGIKQARNLGIKVKKEEVVQITQQTDGFKINTEKNEYISKTLILSTGNKKIKPNIEGIEEFEGKGISYCAICDAFFYRNKNVAVIGDGKFAIHEAEQLENVAKKVTILSNGNEAHKSKFDTNSKNIKCIKGDKRVKQVVFEDGTSIDLEGVFIALGEAGAGDFAKTLGIIQNNDKIAVDEKMATNIKGIFACGDAVGGLLQVNKSAYEGAVAGLSATEYVRKV